MEHAFFSPKPTQHKQLYILDYTKFFLAIIVCSIHTFGDLGWFFPIARLAVPLFFIFSSYFFFSKLNQTDRQTHSIILINFIKRNAILYCFWFIVIMVPQFITNDSIFSSGTITGILTIAVRIIFGSTFTGSWFISSLILGTIIVFFFSKKTNNGVILLLSAIPFIFCCLTSNYRLLFSETGVIYKLLYLYPGTPYRSFPVSIIFITLGKMVADGQLRLRTKPLLIFFILSIFLLFTEQYLISFLQCSIENDVYFMLPFVVIPIFSFLLRIDIFLPLASYIRKLSTILFCIHGGILYYVKHLCEISSCHLPPILLFLIVFSISSLVALLIILLERIPFLRWLKFAH